MQALLAQASVYKMLISIPAIPDSASDESLTACRAFRKQGFSRINLGVFLSAVHRQIRIVSSYIAPLWRDSGGKLSFLRSSTASQCKFSLTLVLLTAYSMKLYSSAAFIFCDHKVCRPVLTSFRFWLIAA